MKRSIGLILLFALSIGSSIAQLLRLSLRKDTLAAEVANSLKKLYEFMTKYPQLENAPEWLGTGTIESARHFQDYGVKFYDIKTAIYFLTIAAVILMLVGKKTGFWVYVLAQIASVSAVIYALGINTVSLIAATVTALIAVLFISLYKKWFLNKLEA